MFPPQETQALGHSASVEAVLLVEDKSYPVAQLGPSRVMLRSPADFPAGRAEVVLKIDGNEERWAVMMPFGAVPFELDVIADPIP